MSAIPPGGGDKKGKRMLPSVSDVVRELQSSSNAEAGLLFKAARQVCADELARVKQGFEAAPLGTLVERARVLIDPSLASVPPSDLGLLFEPAGGTKGAVPPGPSSPGTPPASPDDPFGETTGALDLKWEGKDGFAEPGASPVPPSTEVLPLTNYDSLKGPGEETLAGLERDALALNLSSPGTNEPWQNASAAESQPPAVPGASDEPVFSHPRSASRSPILFGVVALALVGAGFLAWRVVSEKFLGGATPTPVPYPVERRQHPTPEAPRAAVAPQTTPAAAVAPEPTDAPIVISKVKATPIAVAAVRPTRAPLPTPTEPPRATPAPTPTYRLAGGGLAARTPVKGAEPAPAPVALLPTAVPSSVAGTTAPTRVPAPVATPVPTRVAAARPAGRAQAMPSPDWKGKPPVYVIHFTSYHDRKPAEVDAARLARELGEPGHAIQVDLGAKGIYYRAVIGEFATVEEAKAFRAQLVEKKTPNLGLVYYLTE